MIKNVERKNKMRAAKYFHYNNLSRKGFDNLKFHYEIILKEKRRIQ